jgi:hypothetical protein
MSRSRTEDRASPRATASLSGRRSTPIQSAPFPAGWFDNRRVPHIGRSLIAPDVRSYNPRSAPLMNTTANNPGSHLSRTHETRRHRRYTPCPIHPPSFWRMGGKPMPSTVVCPCYGCSYQAGCPTPGAATSRQMPYPRRCHSERSVAKSKNLHFVLLRLGNL